MGFFRGIFYGVLGSFYGFFFSVWDLLWVFSIGISIWFYRDFSMVFFMTSDVTTQDANQ